MKYAKTTTSIKRYLPSGYRKKSVRLIVSPSVSTKSYWDGGSKSYFERYSLTTGISKNVNIDPWGKTPDDPAFNQTLTPEDIITESGTFCGKPSTATFHFYNQECMNKFVKEYNLTIEEL